MIITCTPRPATEKAAFRPALACALLAGASPEKPMTTTYAERLQDPRWQKRRLQMLERADWACACCGDTNKTLHVHHKIYRKGAMPWEYSDSDLQVLCKDCHEAEHVIRDRIKESLAKVDPSNLDHILGYIDGCIAVDVYTGRSPQDDDRAWPLYSFEHACGFAAVMLRRLQPSAAEVSELIEMHPVDDVAVKWLIEEGLPTEFAEKVRRQQEQSST